LRESRGLVKPARVDFAVIVPISREFGQMMVRKRK
jgi:hypothetical protein